MRKLVSIQTIHDIEPIEGADKIEKARVMGWTVVVGKGEFQENDFCVFHEVDSLLPDDNPDYEFMRRNKFRVKTMKMRGVLSQGLALSPDILGNHIETLDELTVGQDVTEWLGVKKYEPPPPRNSGGVNSGRSIGNFPSYVPKTDEIRIQSALEKLDYLRGKPYYITVKYDGSSFTAGRHEDEFFVCSRNFKKDYHNTVISTRKSDFIDVARKLELEKKIPEGIALQGELCGPGVQGNKMGFPDKDVWFYNMFNIKEGTYYTYDEMKEFCENLGLFVVPLEETGGSFDYTLEELLEKAKGKYHRTDRHREGIVIRSMDKRISFKAINNDFLLREK